jgi:predicted nucleic acid-binding protein
VTSQWQLEEIKRVSRYPKVQKLVKPYKVGRLINGLKFYTVMLEEVKAFSDEDDNPLLAMAQVAKAAYLVMGDKSDLLKLETFKDARISWQKPLSSYSISEPVFLFNTKFYSLTTATGVKLDVMKRDDTKPSTRESASRTMFRDVIKRGVMTGQQMAFRRSRVRLSSAPPRKNPYSVRKNEDPGDVLGSQFLPSYTLFTPYLHPIYTLFSTFLLFLLCWLLGRLFFAP